jgi:V/A-type H+-transporting ATPase subunit D
MILNINPNRMELLKLRRRLILARRGHKLLKDKQEELMRQFMALVTEAKRMREDIDKKLETVYQAFFSARLETLDSDMEQALAFPGKAINLKSRIAPIMNLRVPYFECDVTGDLSHGFLDSTGDLDRSLRIIADIFPWMIHMAQIEKHVAMLAAELERTRRRVNALEHILIPSLEETIKYIGNKLNELERGNLTRLMKVKDIVRSH